MKPLLEPNERRKRRDPEICVWDRFVRAHHWLLALSFATLYLEYKKFPLHPYAGYLVLILITLRTLWGFTGKGAARFSSFSYSLKEILTYCRNALAGKASYHFSHNPMGAAMVYALLATLFANCLLGLLAYSASQQLGPFGKLIPSTWEDDLIKVHAVLGHFVGVLVVGHLAGVIWAARLHRENYVLAMLTGLRRIPRAVPLPPDAVHPVKLKASGGWFHQLVNWLSFRHPFLGTIVLMAVIIGGLLLPSIQLLVSLNKSLPAY